MGLEPRKPTTKGPTEWFTGDVYIDAIAQGHGETPTTFGLAHFTPGARSAWHAHEVAQTLYVAAGEGRVQSRGEPMLTTRRVDREASSRDRPDRVAGSAA